MLLGQDNDSIIMTLKNYKKEKGLSTQMHVSQKAGLDSPCRITQKGFDPEMFTSQRAIRKANTIAYSSPRR